MDNEVKIIHGKKVWEIEGETVWKINNREMTPELKEEDRKFRKEYAKGMEKSREEREERERKAEKRFREFLITF